ncbi:AMP-binding enzyme domain-containing protein [Cardiosporidium cionae]|uniref:AMP-binding enzyme domain-containing protein n=1 Tax=Cardiosporidium cionae TaxID=476202 RepID=A0ABQ7JG74_9APIC|nr:AMP-binding enzyme domain-containing protein [Cardiosporidium cionae]|eukprot:KAF8823028.1 AMP-binding enzyme domain-containing protein [Cardiosporidium cionae]
MGVSSFGGYTYSVPLPDTATDDCTSIYRSAQFRDSLVRGFDNDSIKNTWDIFQKGLAYNRNAPFLGTRSKQQNGELGPYAWKLFGEVETLVLNTGAGILHYSLITAISFDDFQPQTEFRFLGIFSKNREEWTLCEYACAAYGFTLVPLYDTLGAESLLYILNLTRLTTIAASEECIMKLLQSEGYFEYLQNIIAFESSEELVELATQKNLKIFQLDAIIAKGKEYPVAVDSISQPTLDSINTICFTSGTTGEPKGALLTHRNFISAIAAILKGPLSHEVGNISSMDAILSYLPLAHVYERIVESVCTSVGARIGFYNGDTMKLKDDILELNPTVFVSVPRLFYRMNDKILAKLDTKSRFLKSLFNYALKLIFNKVKAAMGNNARYLLCGSAPFSSDLQDTFKALFGIPFSQGYGLTESMGGSFVSHPGDPSSGNIGGPIPSLEFKLQSVSDMAYDAHATLPKGELLLRGDSITPGYFRNEKASKEMLDADGWLHTGDVAQIDPNGAVKIIDRKKNIFKLAQGEYIIPEKVEGVLVQSLAIEQVFLFGYSTESYTVAIVVPSEDFAKQWCSQNFITFTSLVDMCELSKFKTFVETDIHTVGKQGGLNGFEIPKAIYLHAIPFSVENEILTPSFKLKRNVATKIFKDQLDELYAKSKK